jgi:hypothetical protein
VLSLVVTGTLLMRFAAIQTPNSFTLGRPPWLDYATIWDGYWYRIIATSGYPSVLPYGTDGHVAENAWAFMPAYPFLVRGLMSATGLSFDVVAVSVSILFGWGTVLLGRRMFVRYLPESAASFATLLLCVSPVAMMFQSAYAESMGLFFLALVLLLWEQRRFWLMIPVVVVLGFTRPAGLALALAMALYLAHRWWSTWRAGRLGTEDDDRLDDDRLTLRTAVPPIVVAVVSGLVGLAWPAIAWYVTGVPKAYTETELTWRAAFIGYKPLTVFLPWLQGIQWWWEFGIGIVAVLLAALIVGVFVLVFARSGRRLGLEMRAWSLGYFVYLLAIFFPQTSTARILLPMFPLLGVVALPRSTTYRVVLVVGSIGLQWVWMYYCWWVNGSDWSPP